MIGENDEILYSWYASNFGSPFHSALKILNDIYRLLPEHAKIAFSAVTGYGEGLIKTALGIDIGEIETIAHYKAAEKAEKLIGESVLIQYAVNILIKQLYAEAAGM